MEEGQITMQGGGKLMLFPIKLADGTIVYRDVCTCCSDSGILYRNYKGDIISEPDLTGSRSVYESPDVTTPICATLSNATTTNAIRIESTIDGNVVIVIRGDNYADITNQVVTFKLGWC